MKSVKIFLALGILMSLFIASIANATPQSHSAAWYRTHHKPAPKHSAAWYRTHRKPAPKHSAAWYKTHRKPAPKHSAAWYKTHRH